MLKVLNSELYRSLVDTELIERLKQPINLYEKSVRFDFQFELNTLSSRRIKWKLEERKKVKHSTMHESE